MTLTIMTLRAMALLEEEYRLAVFYIDEIIANKKKYVSIRRHVFDKFRNQDVT